MRRRPGLIADYRADVAIFKNNVQRFWFAVAVLAVVLLGFGVALPLIPGFVSFGLEGDLIIIGITAMFAAVGAIGLNIVTGYAGQVSLGHAFFLGVGAFTAAALGGVPKLIGSGDLIAYELDMAIWLPVSGLVAALMGLIVSPIAFRLKGLYLAFVTIGLLFVGGLLFREWTSLSGGVGLGREAAVPRLFGWRIDENGEILGVFLSGDQRLFLFAFLVLMVMAFAAKNLARSKVGRAWSAVRDRDIAAEMMGINLSRYKAIAFVISSFYAGVAGALLYTVVGRLEPGVFSDAPGFVLSVRYIAMILIGGIATISGSIMGAFFITFLPRIVRWLAGFAIFGFISESPAGGFVTLAQFEAMLFGLLIVGFLIFEPLGLYGIWLRVRNYWKAWPFSY
jgi:branched-chain amino acid transport system permease protein